MQPGAPLFNSVYLTDYKLSQIRSCIILQHASPGSQSIHRQELLSSRAVHVVTIGSCFSGGKTCAPIEKSTSVLRV
jgi:hypothetical protein